MVKYAVSMAGKEVLNMGEVRKIMPKGMAESRRGDADGAASVAFACASSLSGRLHVSGSERFSCGLREASASASAGILRGGAITI